MKYHAWRHSPDAFTDEYLDAVRLVRAAR